MKFVVEWGYMKKVRPIVSNLEEIIINRQSDGVIIEYVDSDYGTTHLQMPLKAVRELSDEEIMAFYNAKLKERTKHAAANP
ncbi:MAG: hypothetical protein P1U89_23425 [Verrucomicrobiales bacterium]|nr:hypothetical protein [Verrucomicrobiales bacterium]